MPLCSLAGQQQQNPKFSKCIINTTPIQQNKNSNFVLYFMWINLYLHHILAVLSLFLSFYAIVEMAGFS